MFDSIGVALDETARARDARVAMGGTVVGAVLAAALTGLGLLAVRPPTPAAPPDGPLYELAQIDLTAELEAPEAPARGGGAPAPRARVGDPDQDLPPPQQAPDDPPPLTEPAPQAVAADEVDGGLADGALDGTADDEGEGPGGSGSCVGDCEGTGTGEGTGEGDGPGTSTLHDVAPELKRRTELDFPAAARGLGLSQTVCVARVAVDDRGTPQRVDVSGCPTIFHAAVIEGLSTWRWYPARARGQRVAATVPLRVRFVEQ